jgi:hypothetical protein
LHNQPEVNGDLICIFDKFASSRIHYAKFCIAEIPGNRGRKGSAISESNHSSVLSYLNDGVKGTNRYQEHPILLVRDLLTRQQTHVLLTNIRLHNGVQNMRLEQARLKNQPDTFLIKDLRLAASKLNHETYLRYKARQARSHLYLVNKVIDATTNDALIYVQSSQHQDAPP